MKTFALWLAAGIFFLLPASATTITVVPVYEPLSLHGTDGDEVISDIGEALQACVMARPMALTGAFPEVLIDAVRSPHLFPTNNQNYKVREANLLVICQVGLVAEKNAAGLLIRMDVSNLSIPPSIDLTAKQILKLAIVAVRKTLEEYQKPQADALEVTLMVEGTDEKNAGLKELDSKFTVENRAQGQ